MVPQLRRSATAIAFIVASASIAYGAVACTASEPDFCAPAPLTVSPEEGAPGELLTVSADGTDCELGYPKGKEYSFDLNSNSGNPPRPLGSTEVSQDGSFTTTVRLPQDISESTYTLSVQGSTYDECIDTYPSNSCAGYGIDIRVIADR